MAKPVIIEVRANEWSMRAKNPNVPWTAEDFAADAEACRKAGAGEGGQCTQHSCQHVA